MKFCYFGTYNPEWGRSRIYIKGLRALGYEIIECQSVAFGFTKYKKLFLQHWKTRKSYDYLIVGYPGHAVVWFARLLSGKPVIFDALCTLHEGVVLSRGQRGFLGLKSIYIRIVDWLAVKCADVVLVESWEQRKYFENKFGQSDKYKVLYTGADEQVFYKDKSVQKRTKFTVVFRGKFLPEAGVDTIIESAKILEEQEVDFLIIGNGWQEKFVKAQVKSYKLKNLEIITKNLSYEDLRKKLSECHISLGQFGNHERLKRTIPHKCFESLAMSLPYVTARTEPVGEILKDGESVIFVNPASPQDLAEKILMLKNNPDLAKKIGENGYKTYLEKFTPKILAQNILEIIRYFV